MPELPEVETLVRDLNKNILGRKIEDVWSDAPKIIKKPKGFSVFLKGIRNKKIQKVKRRGKNILFLLSERKTLLVHQKMTGHLLLGAWEKMQNSWHSKVPGPLRDDPMNRFLHIIFFLNNGKMLALSDLRKFAKVELWDTKELENSKEMKLGPEPLEKGFHFANFKTVITRKKGRIKQVLMDQNVIAGIGNIYSDEILWQAKIHPLKYIHELKNEQVLRIFKAIKQVLKKAIDLKGDSMSDYRLLSGKKGGYQNVQKVYKQEGKKCQRKDGGIIKRIKIGQRSSRFCPKCQII